MTSRSVLALGSLALAAAALAGCDDTPEEEVPLYGPTISFDMQFPVAAGAEVHICQFVRMPQTGDEIFVSGGDYDTSTGTHHFLVFRTAPDMPEQPLGEPVDCYEGDGVMQYERGFVTGGQLEHESEDFPLGLGLPFESGAVLLMQMHVVNASAAEIDASVHLDLRTIVKERVRERVGTFRFYDPFIYVPAGAGSTAAMRCPISHDVTLLSGGAHMHARGVDYRAYADLAGAPPAVEPFYTTTDWQHPPYWIGAMELPAGSNIRFECDYENASDVPIVQGLSALDDEMCMFSGFYFPALEDDDEDCVEMDQHGTGDRSCAQTTSCIQVCDPSEVPHFTEGRADVGPCFQQCIVDSCPNVTGALFPQLLCSADHCADECVEYGATCSACVFDHCKAELDICQALACDR